jgi:selenocysteine-specific elongation factor
MEPDRWAEERRRGMTIDLGYAWTTLPSGAVLGFVDVPGHARFIGNMLAGLGPAPAVLFVVAADEGWRRQSAEHLAAVDALGLTTGLLAVTRSDLADPEPATEQALEQLATSSLGAVEAVAVSGATGQGVDELRAALDRLVLRLPAPDVTAPGAAVGGPGLHRAGAAGRSSPARWPPAPCASGTRSSCAAARSGCAACRASARRTTRWPPWRGWPSTCAGWSATRWPRRRAAHPGSWRPARRSTCGWPSTRGRCPPSSCCTSGSTAVAVRVRPLGEDTARLQLHTALPLRAGDRALLRDPGAQTVVSGALVLDADPPVLRRRGAAAQRAGALAEAGGVPDLAAEVGRRGAVRRDELASLGVPLDDLSGVQVLGDWLVDPEQWTSWGEQLVRVVDAAIAAAPLEGGPAAEAARRAVGLPDLRLLPALVAAAGLESSGGRVRRPGAVVGLGAAEASVAELERRLGEDPFAAPEADDLAGLRLGPASWPPPSGPAGCCGCPATWCCCPTARRARCGCWPALPQPFTLSAARQALGTTRRVAVPLLEHLDGRGWTRRLDGALREVRTGR